jgi:hypothetical protein
MNMKRIIQIIVAAVLISVAAFALVPLVIYPFIWKNSVKHESIDILEAAQTTNELAVAVGGLGIFLTFPDESWIAIRYRDSHSGGVNSIAVARDSGGMWYQSSGHYCGRFKYYRTEVEKNIRINAELLERGSSETYNLNRFFSEVHAIASSPGLEQARRNLIAMGFKRMQKKASKSTQTTK